jgi:NTP pyrophosphatase (non-canonical NTP hydrolase)
MSYGNKSLADMAEDVRKVNIEHGWRDGTNTFGDYIALLHSELSEALEAYRDYRLADATLSVNDKNWPAETYGLPKPEGVGSELADVFIRLLDMCDVYGIDLEFEYRRKLEYNKTRPYQHGGRTLNGGKKTLRPVSDRSGGSLSGYLDITYAELVAALGEPNAEGDGYKTDAEWTVELSDGTKASIYNYKNGRHYLGDEGLAVEDITDWHVGSPLGGYAKPEGHALVARLNAEIRGLLSGGKA